MRLRELKRKLYIIARDRLDEADLEVRLMVSLATGIDALGQLTEPDREISESEAAEAERLLRLRLEGVPEAYLAGHKEFFGLDFMVTEDVLIPQPDTEILVESAIEAARRFDRPRVLDLCTGSGCIGTSIAFNVPSADVFMSDISEKAASVARRNFETIVGRKAEVRVGDLFDPWSGMMFDVIASNPPYLTAAWYEETGIEVKHEPRLALLDSAADGLGIIERLVQEAMPHLAAKGALLIESDYRQTDAVRAIMQEHGLSCIETIKDLSGKQRCTRGFLF